MFIKSLPFLASLLCIPCAPAASLLNPSFENGVPLEEGTTGYSANTAPAGWTVWSHWENTPTMLTNSPTWYSSANYVIPGASAGDRFVSLESYLVRPDSETTLYGEGGIRTTVSGLTVGATYTVSVDAATLMLPNQTIYSDQGFLDAYVGDVGATLELTESLSITEKIVFDSQANVVSRAIGTYSFSFIATEEEMDIGFRSRITQEVGLVDSRRFNVSVDNVTIAVPEPSSVMIAGLAAAGALVRRRRL